MVFSLWFLVGFQKDGGLCHIADSGIFIPQLAGAGLGITSRTIALLLPEGAVKQVKRAPENSSDQKNFQ
jgi:hypothetical protein